MICKHLRISRHDRSSRLQQKAKRSLIRLNEYLSGVPRKINVSGTQTAITLATQLISYVMDNGPTLPPLGGGGMMGGMGGGMGGQGE